MLRLGLLVGLLNFALSIYANNGGHEIVVKFNNFQEKEAYLATYYGENPFIVDTVALADDRVVFKGEEVLESGVYLIVIPPNNQFLQIFIDQANQHFELEVDVAKLDKNDITIKGSPDNELFYEYVGFLNSIGPKAQELRQQIKTGKEAGKATTQQEEELNQINQQVKEKQNQIVAKNPKSMVANWIKFGFEPEIPEYKGEEETVQRNRFYYRKAHFFDQIDMTDPSHYHNPMMFKKVDYYINQMTPTIPDSINQSIDLILEKVRPAQKTFEFYLRHFLNTYAESKLVGMDAVYVHLVDKYYAAGKADWLEQETLDKIINEAKRLRPLLIGRTAPDIKMTKEDGSKFSLYDIDSDYTILFFWRPGCSHCEKATPHLLEFYEKFKDKSVKVMASCIKIGEEAPKCWEFVKSKKMEPLINVYDPFNTSKFHRKYDTRITPKILILDKDKKILVNRIGAEQLEEVMDQIIEQDNRKLQEQLENGD
ncbi:MAG: redoxin domain-containing protein [Bacteroidota bacterium]